MLPPDDLAELTVPGGVVDFELGDGPVLVLDRGGVGVRTVQEGMMAMGSGAGRHFLDDGRTGIAPPRPTTGPCDRSAR